MVQTNLREKGKLMTTKSVVSMKSFPQASWGHNRKKESKALQQQSFDSSFQW